MTEFQVNMMFDLNAVQENLKNMFDVNAVQENINTLFSLENNQAMGCVKDCTQSLVDQERVEKNLKLASSAVTANTYVVADTLTLTAIQLREGVEGAFNHLEELVKCGDIKEVAKAQHDYAQTLHDTLIERTSMNASMMAGVLETNANFAKEAIAQFRTE